MRHDHIPYPALDEAFGFVDKLHQVVLVDVFAHEDQVDHRVVEATCKGTGDEHFIEVAQLVDDLEDLIKSYVLEENIMDIPEEGMLCVGPEQLLVAVELRVEQSCLLELVQFQAYGVTGLAKLAFQVTQVAAGVAVQEELQQQFYARLGCDQRFKHSGSD